MAVPVQKRHALVAVTTPWRDTSARDCPAEAQPLLMLMLMLMSRRRSMPGAWMLPRPLPQLRRDQHALEGDRHLPATTERAILSVAARSSHKTRRWAPLRTSCCCGTCRRWPCRSRRGRSSQMTCWRWRSQRRAFRGCCRPTWHMPVVALGRSKALLRCRPTPRLRLASSRSRCRGGMRVPLCGSSLHFWAAATAAQAVALQRQGDHS